jgi:hypothetical protein
MFLSSRLRKMGLIVISKIHFWNVFFKNPRSFFSKLSWKKSFIPILKIKQKKRRRKFTSTSLCIFHSKLRFEWWIWKDYNTVHLHFGKLMLSSEEYFFYKIKTVFLFYVRSKHLICLKTHLYNIKYSRSCLVRSLWNII